MVDTHILKIDTNIGKYDFDRLLNCVSEQKKERIRRFHRFEDAQRSLIGDVLTRYVLCNKLSIRNKDLVFGTNEYGKPLLLEPNGIHFNISHSGSWIVCAVGNKTIGIDVEIIKPIDLEIAERFFTRDGYISLMDQPEEMKLKYFYMIWTLKESYIKAEGKGLSIPLNTFTIRMKNNNINVITENKIKDFYFYQSFTGDDAIYSICSLSSNVNESICLNIDNFLNIVRGIVVQLSSQPHLGI